MRFLKRLLTGLLVIVVIAAAGAYLLPRKVDIARSIMIDAPPEAVFPLVNSLQKASRWSPWLSRDPQAQLTYEGPQAGVGNAMRWASDVPGVGSGSQVITISEPARRVVSQLEFGVQGPATAAFLLEPEGAATRVTWTLEADMGNTPIGRYMGLMMDEWVGGDYERGLADLKALAKGG